MSKKKKGKSSQFPPARSTAPTAKPSESQTTSQAEVSKAVSSPQQDVTNSHRVQPEQMSLNAHAHIQKYLKDVKKEAMEKEDLNAVLRLSQHLRVFGLLSAVGYVNQSNAQENNETRKRTVPVWGSLLGQLLGKEIDTQNSKERKELMEAVLKMANEQPDDYMANWRKSLMLAEQWNFWARAYAKGEECTPALD